MATFRCATSASRRRNVRTVNGSCWGRPPDGVGGCGVDGGVDSGGVATSRPATNITGASCVKSSGGYEFIIPSLQVSGTERALATGYARNAEHNISPTLAVRENMALYLDISFPGRKAANVPYPSRHVIMSATSYPRGRTLRYKMETRPCKIRIRTSNLSITTSSI